jgi:hypothetical protein
MSWNAPPPIDISKTPPSMLVRKEKRLANVNWAEADVIGNGGESSLTSVLLLRDSTNAELGGVSLKMVPVCQGVTAPGAIATVDQPAGRVGGITVSKFSEQAVTASGDHGVKV